MIDIHVLSDQGNIFDACGLAAIAALRTTVVPAERFDVVRTTRSKSTVHPSWRRSPVSVDDLFLTPTSTRNSEATSASTSRLVTQATSTHYRRG